MTKPSTMKPTMLIAMAISMTIASCSERERIFDSCISRVTMKSGCPASQREATVEEIRACAEAASERVDPSERESDP